MGSGIDVLLARARTGYRRVQALEAWEEAGRGARLVDTRPESQRRAVGDLPGAIVIERNHLEWRLDPRCEARIPEAIGFNVRWILICSEGYSTSLAVATLRQMGLNATDVIGGVDSWIAEGLPLVRGATPATPRGPGEGPPSMAAHPTYG